jgi:hypothetical protein
LDRSFVPPIDCGTMWSTVRSTVLPQAWQALALTLLRNLRQSAP